jgi:hypothetical protein
MTATFQKKKFGISKTFARRLMVLDAHTPTPVRADTKHSLPILRLFRSHATGERFGFPAVSTADETLGTPQAESAKLAKVKVLPQLQEDIPGCST